MPSPHCPPIPTVFEVRMSNFHGGIVLPQASGSLTPIALPSALLDAAPVCEAEPVQPFGVRTGMTLAEASAEVLLAEIRASGIVEADGQLLAEHIEKALERSNAGKLRQVAVSLLEPDPASLSLSSLGVEFADAIAGGLSILLKLLSVREGSILCDKDRTETLRAIREACRESRLIAVEYPENRYPQAHPKLIVRWLCQKELSYSSAPEAAGLFLTDAESCIALHQYFATGTVRSRVRTTLYENGEGRVYDLPLGLSVDALVKAGVFATLPDKAAAESLCRGLMDGRPAPAVADRSLAVLTPAPTHEVREGDCIRCGKCSLTCPMFLQPYRYLPERPWIALLSGKPRDAENCIGCGSCSFVCPAHLPLRRYALEARERALEKIRLREEAPPQKKGGR